MPIRHVKKKREIVCVCAHICMYRYLTPKEDGRKLCVRKRCEQEQKSREKDDGNRKEEELVVGSEKRGKEKWNELPKAIRGRQKVKLVWLEQTYIKLHE